MNNMLKISLIFCVLILSLPSKAQKVKTDTLTVYGNCGMCKDRIEQALDVKGIAFAAWDVKTDLLTVSYKPEKISLNQISLLLNKVGHDTRISKADDQDYEKLHGCCNYRDSKE
jgi:copper chaperone CopZ